MSKFTKKQIAQAVADHAGRKFHCEISLHYTSGAVMCGLLNQRGYVGASRNLDDDKMVMLNISERMHELLERYENCARDHRNRTLEFRMRTCPVWHRHDKKLDGKKVYDGFVDMTWTLEIDRNELRDYRFPFVRQIDANINLGIRTPLVDRALDEIHGQCDWRE